MALSEISDALSTQTRRRIDAYLASVEQAFDGVVDVMARRNPILAPDIRSWAEMADLGLVGAEIPDLSRAITFRRSGGSRFEIRRHSNHGGWRHYRVYVPDSLRGRPRALIVMLHGCKQDSGDFAVGTGMNALAEEHGLIVAYPEQSREDSRLGCWNWFRPRNQSRGLGEPAIIAGITRELMVEFRVDRSRVFVAGLSAGGAMAVVMGDCYPDLFSAIGVHSGLPSRSARTAFSAIALMRGRQGYNLMPWSSAGQPMRTIVFHGTADTTVHPDNAARIASAALSDAEFEMESTTGESAGGRHYGTTAARAADGQTLTEVWMVEGSKHGWSGGSEAGSYTDPAGPDASAEMLRFFLDSPKSAKAERQWAAALKDQRSFGNSSEVR